MPLAGKPLLYRMLERVQRIRGLDAVCLAIPEGKAHDPIAKIASSEISLYRGDEQDVLDRTFRAAQQMKADTVMRVTSDCPLIDPEVSGDVLSAFENSPVAYARTAFDSGYPHGFDTEVFSFDALSTAHSEASEADEREHVTPFIWRRPDRFPAMELDHRPDLREWRLTVDTPEDYELISQVFDTIYPQNPNFGFAELKNLFAEQPRLLEINASVSQPKLAGMPGES